jgi:hypothetical protein
MLRAALTALLLLAATGCGPRFVKGTEIEYTEEKQELADVVERYRVAVEQRDSDALRSLASRRYYENGSTTEDPSDDYDYRGLDKLLSELEQSVKAAKYAVEIKAIQILGEAANVDYTFTAQYLVTVGEQDRWSTAGDKNRLAFRRENGAWRIISGM